MLKGWTKRFCSVLFLHHTELLCQGKSIAERLAVMRNMLLRLCVCGFNHSSGLCCWGSGDTPRGAELVGIMAE